MKRLVSILLCIVMLVLITPVMSSADSGYSQTSNLNVDLEYPSADSYYATPLRAQVKSTRPNGSIYFMPVPRSGNGVLGTVANGTEVTILAEQSGYYFFVTNDGRMGWNGKKFFTILGAATGYAQGGNSCLFFFDGGASVTLPAGFQYLGVERDTDAASVSSYYTCYAQSMDLTLTEINTFLSYPRSSGFMSNLYLSLKNDYPRPTYDMKKENRFALSGYTGDCIYYFEGFLSDQVIYLIKMFYPTRNRSVCDRYVEAIVNSFSDAPSGISVVPFSVKIPDNPSSPYGIAMVNYYLYGVSYSDQEKKNVVNDTYYSRKDSKGNRRSWYTSATYDDPNTGYRIGFYYADGMVFFADAYVVGQRSVVTFYFWGDQLLCVHDKRNGDSHLQFAGSAAYERVVRDFGDLYPIALERAR